MDKKNKQPVSVDEAVDLLIEELSFGDRTIIVNMKEEDLGDLDFVFRSRIMFEFGLWNENEELLQSCRDKSGQMSLEPDTASNYIINRLWKTLQNTPVLKVVK